MQPHTLKSGERVMIDPNLTIQTIYSRYYWLVPVVDPVMMSTNYSGSLTWDHSL